MTTRLILTWKLGKIRKLLIQPQFTSTAARTKKPTSTAKLYKGKCYIVKKINNNFINEKSCNLYSKHNMVSCWDMLKTNLLVENSNSDRSKPSNKYPEITS
jgi:uncharacterized protein YlzI (FlbEa/FlbD family)